MTEPQEVPNAVFTGEPERVERGWSVHADWDWQRFLVGWSFQTSGERGGAYFAVNLGFACLFIARDRWSPWA